MNHLSQVYCPSLHGLELIHNSCFSLLTNQQTKILKPRWHVHVDEYIQLLED